MRRDGSTPVRMVWGAVVAAYIVCGVAALLFVGPALHAPDEREYLAIGRNLAKLGFFSLDGVVPTAWRSPGLPVIIAAVWAVWPSVTVLKCTMLAAWAGTGLLAGRIAASLQGEIVGLAVSCLYLCYLYELYAATTLYPQTILAFFVTVSVWIVLSAPILTRGKQTLLLLATIAEICLVPNAVVVPAVLYTYALLKRKMRFRQAAAAASLSIAIVLAWCIRNEHAMGTFGFTTSVGITLYDGNRDHITAATAGSPDSIDLPDNGKNLTETAIDRIYRRQAVAWISTHPAQAVKLFGAKLLYFFAPSNKLESQHDIPLARMLTVMMAVLYYVVLAGSLVACFSRKKAVREAAWIAWAIYLGTALSYAVFLTRLRYRLPVDPLLFVVAPWLAFAGSRSPAASFEPVRDNALSEGAP